MSLVVASGGDDEADVAGADEVGKWESHVLVALGHRDHEADVTEDQALEGALVALTDFLSQLHLLVDGEERLRGDVVQVGVDGAAVARGDLGCDL